MASSSDPVRVGVVGLGRSGWGIHCTVLRQMPERYRVVAVHDPLVDRAQQAAADLDARSHESFESLLEDRQVDLVVVASPSSFHAPQSLAALRAGKHVLCEKPFGLGVADADAMIDAARDAGVLVQPFQQRRYEPDFLKVLEVCRSGVLGRIEFVRIAWHGFKRRWDWQTLTDTGGGQLNNNGPHLIDHAMCLFGPDDDVEPDVWCDLRRCLCSGDAEDHVKIVLSARDHPTIEVELSDTFAFGQDRWLICGNAGGLVGNASKLSWKWVDWSSMPDRPVQRASTPDRSYNNEKLPWQHATWEAPAAADTGGGAAPAAKPVIELYGDLFRSIREGVPQVITPQSVRRRVSVMERAHQAARRL
jgi:predicted dehydrogenase